MKHPVFNQACAYVLIEKWNAQKPRERSDMPRKFGIRMSNLTDTVRFVVMLSVLGCTCVSELDGTITCYSPTFSGKADGQ